MTDNTHVCSNLTYKEQSLQRGVKESCEAKRFYTMQTFESRSALFVELIQQLLNIVSILFVVNLMKINSV